MKIIYDYRIFSLQRYGGISRYFYELVKNITALRQDDIELYLFQGLHINEYPLYSLKNKLNYYWGYKRPYVKRTLNLFYNLNKLIFNFFKNSKTFRNCDVIYHPTYYGKDVSIFNPKSKMVITVYDMIHEKFPKYFPNISNELFIKKKTIETADKIICISKSTKKDLLEYYNIDKKKVDVIYLGPSLEDSNLFNYYQNYDHKKPYILFVGERKGYKNFLLLLDSFYHGKFYKDFNLICFGGKQPTSDEIKKIKDYKLEKDIIFLKGKDDLLVSLYKNAHCLVYPSLYEGFGMPVLEAMTLGCPVIASNSSSIPEIAGNAALLFNPNNQDDLISKLNEVTSSNKKRNELIKSGLKQSKKFTWVRTAEQTIRLYQNCIK